MNEVLQWLSIGFLAMGVLAAYRQLGLYVLGARGVIEETFGPRIGERAPERYSLIFGATEGAGYSGRRVAVYLSARCPICEEILAYLESDRTESDFQSSDLTLGLVGEDPDHLREIQRRVPWAQADTVSHIHPKEDRPGGFPFFIEVGGDGLVTNKKLGTNGLDLLHVATPQEMGGTD